MGWKFVTEYRTCKTCVCYPCQRSTYLAEQAAVMNQIWDKTGGDLLVRRCWDYERAEE